MMSDIVRIGDINLEIVEYRGERVVTFAMIDRVHERPDGTASGAFRRNRDRFEEGRHYFRCETSEAEKIGVTAPNGLTLLTERGYVRLCKVFNDAKSWQIFDDMEEVYFGDRPALSPGELLLQNAQRYLELERGQKRQEERQDRIEQRQDHIEANLDSDTGYVTLLAFCKSAGLSTATTVLQKHSYALRRICLNRGIERGRAPSERYDTVRTYPRWLLVEYFDIREA